MLGKWHAKTWMMHLPRFLDEQGNLPKDLSVPARRLVKAICEFVTYATNFDGEGDELPQCFAITKRKRCQGKVMPLVTVGGDNIGWHCSKCESSGFISGWQGTLWDLSELHEVH